MNSIPNVAVKIRIFEAGLRHYEIAKAIGVSENTLSRWMRYPLSIEHESTIDAAIEKLKLERGAKQ